MEALKPKHEKNKVVLLITGNCYVKIISSKFCSTLENENIKKWHYELEYRNKSISGLMVEEEYLSNSKNTQKQLQTLF